MMEECKIIQKLPKAFRIFLELEEEARGEKTNNPYLLSRNVRSEHSVNEEVLDER